MRKEVIAGVVAILVVGSLGIGYLSENHTQAGTSITASYTSTRVSSPVYQVLESNVTLHGQAAALPCEFFYPFFLDPTCSRASTATLTGVQLVKYGSAYYYSLTNQSGLTGFGNPLKPYPYDIWFTNSTVFCVSYAANGSATFCPSLPSAEETITIPSASASTLNSSNGLRLTLSLSAASAGLVNISVSEFNTLDRANKVTNGSRVDGGFFLWPGAVCSSSPIGYEVVKGDYGQSNFTMGMALALGIQSPVQCGEVMGVPDYSIFQPQSRVANLSLDSSGFWMGSLYAYSGNACFDGESPSPSCRLSFLPYSPGTYTVVAGDEWGGIVALHFNVSE